MAITAPAHASTSRRSGSLLVAALVVVLAWQLAHWTWAFLAPAPLAPPAPAESPTDLAVAARLFGGTIGAGGNTTAASTSSLKLKGVVAPTPGVAASAIFNTGSGRDLSIYVGNDVQPGVKLVEVLPDAAIVSRAGVRERIELEQRKSAAGAPGTRYAPASQQFRLNVAASGNSFALSRKELDDTLKDPQQLNYLGRIAPQPAPGGGVRMDAAPAGSLAAKLGLQPGDVIRKVNGQAIQSPGDLALLYQKFGTLSTVQAEVLRGGNVIYLAYSINP